MGPPRPVDNAHRSDRAALPELSARSRHRSRLGRHRPLEPRPEGQHRRPPQITYVALAVTVLTILVVAINGGRSLRANAALSRSPNFYDSMHRLVSRGLGISDNGYAWTTSPARQFSVLDGVANIGPVPRGNAVRASVEKLNVTDEQLQATLSLRRLPTSGRGTYFSLESRRQIDGSVVRAHLRIWPKGKMTLGFSTVHHRTERPLGRQVTLTGTARAGERITFESSIMGSTSGTLSARAWATGTPKPDWQLTNEHVTGLPASGGIGFYAYTSSGTVSSRLAMTNMKGWALGRGAAGPPDRAATLPNSSSPIASPSSTSASMPKSTRSEATDSSKGPRQTDADSLDPHTRLGMSRAAKPSTSRTSRNLTPSSDTSTTSRVGDQPGPTNTGVPAGTELTRHNGDLTATKAGATYSGLDIYGFVNIKAPNVTIKNSIIRGGRTTVNKSLVTDTSPDGANFVIKDSELVPTFPSVHLNGISGSNYTAVRINVHGTVDTADVFGNNVAIENSWLHNMRYYAHDPNQADGPSHNDGVQVQAGSHIRITGNTIEGGKNSALQVTQDVGPVSDLVFRNNLVSGGMCTVNLAHKPLPTMSDITVSNNRFVRGSTDVPNCAIISGPGTSLTASGDVWADSSKQVVVSRGA